MVEGVTVIVPSLDYGQYIGTAIGSALAQDSILQLLVQDNCSQDNTVAVLKSVSDDRLVWNSRPDGGQSAAINGLISAASHEVIGWLNADELYTRYALEVAIGAFKRYPHIDVIYGDSLFCDEAGTLLRLVSSVGPSEALLRAKGCYISTCAMFFRSKVGRAFPLREDLRSIMDWEWYLRLMAGGIRFGYVPVPLGIYRVHPRQITYTEPQSRLREITDVRTVGEQAALRRQVGGGRTRQAMALYAISGDLIYKARKIVGGGTRRERTMKFYAGADLLWPHRSAAQVDRAMEQIVEEWRRAGASLQC